LPLPPTGESLWQAAIRVVLDRAVAAAAGPITAVGHRIVHGGLGFAAPVVVTPELLAGIEALEPLAPLHQPQGVAGIHAASERLPAAVQVACFDTAFHHTCPPEAMRFALPRPWHDRGVRRYGFHGLSYESIVGRLPLVAGELPERLIVAHLGAGASLAAIHAGRSIATTMGFTPLDGLVMATRSGAIDPGAVLHLITAGGLSAAGVERLLTRESGLLGVSGISGDMRELLASADPQAAEAVGLFCYRAIREIGSLVAALGGLDAIVFTAGIGEHAAEIRRRIVAGLAWLGLDLDLAANAAHGPRITQPASRVAAWVIPTDEEAVIAAHVRRRL
jgi:acetate kinase